MAGVVVNDYCRTADPDILAAVDCTSQYNVDLRLREYLVPTPSMHQSTVEMRLPPAIERLKT